MSAPVGSVKSGQPISSGAARQATNLSNKSNAFRELAAKGHKTPLGGGLVGRPVAAAEQIGKREESEPRQAPPLQSQGPGPGPAESERESAASSDANPSWQPGALDPLALFGAGPLSGTSLPVASAPPGLDPLVGELLRSIAWAGDRRRGTARIELGAGRYRGTTLRVDVVGDALHIDLEAPAGVDAAELGARLSERFEARGLRVESLLVR